MTMPTPTALNLQAAERVLEVSWTDGHASRFPLRYLRGWCPCAACQGHGNTRVFIPVADPVLVNAQPVGNYGFAFIWQDNHGTGIYTFKYLRELCPCPACKPGGIDPAQA